MSINNEFVCALLGTTHNGVTCDHTGEGYREGLAEFAPQVPGAAVAAAPTIPRIESTDTENMVVLRDLESGTYVLYGRFKPFAGSDSTMTFSSSLLVNLIRRSADTQIQIFYPVNNCIQYLKITDTEYERKDVYLNDLAAAQA